MEVYDKLINVCARATDERRSICKGLPSEI